MLSHLKSKVKCESFKSKKPLNIDHVHETKSMHILTLKLKISKKKNTLITEITDSNVEKSKIF